MVNRNASAIRTLQQQQWGPVQHQTSVVNQSMHVLKMHPLLLHVTNPNSGMHVGPFVFHQKSTGVCPYHTIAHGNAHFEVYTGQGPSAADMDAHDQFNVANGPKCMLRTVTLEFEFKGLVDCTNIRVQVIRQKKSDTDFYQPNLEQQFLPWTLDGMTDMAGFTPNRIDTSKFQILADRKIYMNSKGTANALDGVQDRNTADPTTGPCKRASIYLKLNKVLKQLKSSVNQVNEIDDLDHNNGTGDWEKGSYNHDNQHPLSNLWCLISTDDATAFGEALTGDVVTCNISRRLTWQDPRA